MDDQLYEINVKRFIQSTEYQLKKLNDCISRLNEFQAYEDWTNVKQAHLNASQIIKRIKSDIKEIEKIRNQIVSKLENKKSNEIVNKIDEQLKDITRKLNDQIDQIDSLCAPYLKFEFKNHNIMLESNYAGPGMFDLQIQKDEYMSQDKDLCNAFDQLQKDCEDLKHLMETFSKEIYSQGATIDSIEKNITTTQENVTYGSNSLKDALKYKTLGTAAGCAAIGTVVGGPIGFIAGAKIGAVVGLGTGLVGYFVSKRLNKPAE